MSDIFVGRQPIYDRQLNVVAYELLFRSSADVNQAQIMDGNQATSQVVYNAFMEIGLDLLVGSKRAVINLTRDFILQDYTALFPTDRVVLEVLEDIVIDVELIEAVRGLSSQGYTIALDDFIYYDQLRPLVELADIVKIDILALDCLELQRCVAQLSRYKVQLLAEKVETRDAFAICQDLGFDYFQGYFLCQPDIVTGARSPANRAVLLNLLAKLQNPQAAVHEIESILGQDVALSYKLLRLINADPGTPRAVESIHQALSGLDVKFITAWGSLLMLADIDDKPHELMVTAMVRGKMCEFLAEAMGASGKERFFTVGLFSVLHAMLDSPMTDILLSLPLATDVARALLLHEGVLGQTLQCVLAYEHRDWGNLDALGLDRRTIRDAYLNALAWTSNVSNRLAMSC
jgi:EAL and modified HD-GYP domain-containing signal transduction protein